MQNNSNNEKLLADILKALANEDRIKILKLIINSDKPLHIKALTELLKTDYANVYKNVKILEKAGILGVFVVGRSRVPYVKKKEELAKLFDQIGKII